MLTSALVQACCQQRLCWDKSPRFLGMRGVNGEYLGLIVGADIQTTSASRKHLSIHLYLNLENLRK